MSNFSIYRENFFAAFLMTYERPKIILKTLDILLHQTFPPSYILVVDNSETFHTEEAVKKLQNPAVGYYRVGYNSGPAGAAKIGLEELTKKGFKWIYWGDDDNPPMQKTVFEDIFKELERNNSSTRVGVIGGKGGNLNTWTGRIQTFSNSQLRQNKILEVDVVSGGGTLLVNAEVVNNQIIPSEKLFFGFEELDFCLKVKNKGFEVVVLSKIWLQENYQRGFLKDNYKWKDSFFGKPDLLWRNYYSTRNLLYIFYTHKFLIAFLYLLVKTAVKSMAGYFFGKEYGRQNFELQWRAVLHFLKGSFGEVKFRRN